jgi:hypothetical protein
VTCMDGEWKTYRTRFLVRAQQLQEPLTFVDCIGREHSGQKGDYLVQSSDGSRRIAPREIFEDIYVPIDSPESPTNAPVPLCAPQAEPVDAQARASLYPGQRSYLQAQPVAGAARTALPLQSLKTETSGNRRSPMARPCIA